MSIPWSTGRKVVTAVLGAVAVAALALGCGSASATKAGRSSDPVVLRAAGADVVPAVEFFRKRVAELSHGTVRVEIVDAWDDALADREQRWVRYVARGTADIGWARTWVFDTLGVKSFRALTAPMLIDSYPLERAVIAAGIPDLMLPGLDKLRVTGLAVVADGLSKPIAVNEPLLAPADWRGTGFGIARSSGKVEALRAIGARSYDAVNYRIWTFLESKRIQAFEQGLRLYYVMGLEQAARHVTANVNLWPAMWALIVSPRGYAKLSGDQQKWLRQAAAEAAARSTSLAGREGPLVKAVCTLGARFARASAADVAGLRAAFAPALADLRRDPQTKAFIDQILKLKQSTAAGPALAIPPGCAATLSSTPSRHTKTGGTR